MGEIGLMGDMGPMGESFPHHPHHPHQPHNPHQPHSSHQPHAHQQNSNSFTDAEWKRFYTTILANQNNGIIEKTRLIQEDNVQTFQFDNGEQKNVRIFDDTEIGVDAEEQNLRG
jgi:hypothetical protein